MPIPRTVIDPRLAEWATPTQLNYLEITNELGSMRKAATQLGLANNSVKDSLRRLKLVAARQGYSPDNDMTRPVPDGFNVKRISTNYKADGSIGQQWVIGEQDKERQQEIMEAAVAAMVSGIKGKSPLVAGPKRHSKDLLAIFPIGDPHIGLQSWAEESGEAFDLRVARALTLSAVDRLMSVAPDAETGIILLLGDVFHMNDQTNVTPGHKHQLDADSRFVKVLQVGIEMYRHAIQRALEKFKNVVVRVVSGNHDPQASWTLAFTLAAFFDNNKRVRVDLSPAPFWYYRFGKVLIGSTHGDKVKHETLPGVMACDKAKDWGDTEYRYWYTGHVHSQHVREFAGVTCESFRTLAAKDAYATGHGYRAGRDMVCIVHHKDFGEVERHRADIGMLK